ncbi:MAG: dephospho-CoA kinase [Clostridiales Family XIII bacterium]|jgi:dephospho-CoA kinase|nr:dephospho-CoA kinase [Clostridiales Family XIII bacterium]
MKVIGLTGGIGSGKSAAGEYLCEKGYAVIDADALAREAVAVGSAGLSDVAARFGEDVLLPDGSLDRKALAARVFSDADALAALNAILHGRILREMRARTRRLREAGAKVVFLNVPLLIETGMQSEVDAVWLVDADEEERVRRVVARDGVAPEDARRRIAAQLPSSEKRCCASETIDNSGTLGDLHAAMEALLEKYGYFL